MSKVEIETLWSLCLSSSVHVLHLDAITPSDSYIMNYRELATLLTPSECFAGDGLEPLTIESMHENLATEPSWHLLGCVIKSINYLQTIVFAEFRTGKTQLSHTLCGETLDFISSLFWKYLWKMQLRRQSCAFQCIWYMQIQLKNISNIIL